jgi:hypothetical protein
VRPLTPPSCAAPALAARRRIGQVGCHQEPTESPRIPGGADEIAPVPCWLAVGRVRLSRPLGLLIPVELLEGRVSAYLMVSACFRRLLERGLGQEWR